MRKHWVYLDDGRGSGSYRAYNMRRSFFESNFNEEIYLSVRQATTPSSSCLEMCLSSRLSEKHLLLYRPDRVPS